MLSSRQAFSIVKSVSRTEKYDVTYFCVPRGIQKYPKIVFMKGYLFTDVFAWRWPYGLGWTLDRARRTLRDLFIPQPRRGDVLK